MRYVQAEGVRQFQPLAPTAFNKQLRETLLCFVLIDSLSAHAFCSRYDFGPWPLLPGVDCLPADVHRVSRYMHTVQSLSSQPCLMTLCETQHGHTDAPPSLLH